MTTAISAYIKAEFEENAEEKTKQIFLWCLEHMDDDIREILHNKYGLHKDMTDAIFLDMYCDKHFKKFGEHFVIN